MKKILNISTIISTGVLNFIKAADEKNIAEKNILLFVDGNEYKVKEEDNENVNVKDNKSVVGFLEKRINNKKIVKDILDKSIYDCYLESSIDGTSYTQYNNKSNFNFLKFNFFKKIKFTEENNFKINNNAFTGQIVSLEFLKMILKNFEKDPDNEKLINFSSAPFKKLEIIYSFLINNNIIKPNELIVSYKIDGNETKIYDFIAINDLEKIYEAISQKKQVDIVSKKIDINYYFKGQYFFNNKEFTEEQFNKLNNLNNILSSKYISFNSLTEEEVKNYLKDQYGIDGNVIFESDENDENDENVKYITLPDKYLLCRVHLSLTADESEDKTLKYDYLNQLELNSLKIYPKGTKYSELEKYIEDQFNFLKDKKYKLQFHNGDELVNIASNEEIITGEVTIYIDNDEVNNDLYEAINKNIKNVRISIRGDHYSFYLANLKNKNILDLIKNILDKCYNKKIEDFDINFKNSKNENIEINDNENELDKKFIVKEGNVIIILDLKEKKKKKEDEEKDKNKQQNPGTTTTTEGDTEKTKNKTCGCY